MTPMCCIGEKAGANGWPDLGLGHGLRYWVRSSPLFATFSLVALLIG
jgi:hypothetical protein